MSDNKKHFIAINNETGERIDFGVEDIYSVHKRCSAPAAYNMGYSEICIRTLDLRTTGTDLLETWLSDYTLYYLHQGKYYNYETQEEMG